MREEEISMTQAESELLNKYAKSEGVSQQKALKRAFFQSIKKRFHDNLSAVIKRFKNN